MFDTGCHAYFCYYFNQVKLLS